MMKTMKKMALVSTFVWSIVMSAVCYENTDNTDQKIAEFATLKDCQYDDLNEITIDVISTDQNDNYGGEVISYVIDDGETKCYRTINKNYYQNLMAKE